MKIDLYVADVIELLASGKLVAMGLFPDRKIVLNVPHDAPDPSDEMPYGVNLTLCITISNLEPGEHEIGIQIEDPNGRRVPVFQATRRRVMVGPGQSATNALVPLSPLPATALGTFSVVCSVDDQEHRSTFDLLQHRLPPPSDADRPSQ